MIHPKHWHFLPVPSLSLQTLQAQMQFEPNRFHKARTSLRIDQFKRKNYLSVSYIFFFFCLSLFMRQTLKLLGRILLLAGTWRITNPWLQNPIRNHSTIKYI